MSTRASCIAILLAVTASCGGAGRGWESLPRPDQELWIACESQILRAQCGPDPTARTIDRSQCEQRLTKRFLALNTAEERRGFLAQQGCRAAGTPASAPR